MLRLISLLTISVYILLVNSCLDLGCLGGGGDDYSPTRVYIFSLNQDNSVTLIDSLSYGGYEGRHQINYSFGEFEYSIDGEVALWGYRHNRLIEHTGKMKYSDSLEYFLPNLQYDSQVDVFPTEKISLIRNKMNNSLIDSVFIQEHYNTPNYNLGKFSIPTQTLDTLLGYNSRFIDSLTYKTDRIIYPKFDVNGNIIFVSSSTITKITSDSLQQNFFYNPYYNEAKLVRLNTDSSLDTLASINFAFENQYSLNVTQTNILLLINNDLWIFDYEGRLLEKIANSGQAVPNLDGGSLVTNNDNVYTRFEDGLKINLSGIYPTLNYSFPSNENIYVVHENRTKLSVFDVDSQSSIITISLENFPKVHNSKSRISNFSFENPFNFNGSTIFFYVDNFYIDDPNDPCD